MNTSHYSPFEGCFYLSLGEIQKELDSYYEKHGSCLSLADAVLRLRDRNLHHSTQRNSQLIATLYHHDFYDNYSPSYLSSMIKKVTGKTLGM